MFNMNLPEDIMAQWMEVEGYMAEFRIGSMDNYDICYQLMKNLARAHMKMVVDEYKKEERPLEIPSFMRS